MDSSTTAPRTELTSRLPSDAHIGRVRLRVSDLERSLGFYRDLLGFRVEREEGSKMALAARPVDPGPRARQGGSCSFWRRFLAFAAGRPAR